MRKLDRYLLPLLALLLTAAGAALPWVVSDLQDAQVERGPEARQFDPVNLTLQTGGGVQETLGLLAGSYSDLEWTGKTNLTAAEAASAAQEAVRFLNESGLTALTPETVGEEAFTISVEPHIIMSMTESSVSAIVWGCWIDELPENWIYIDDDTGKMVRTFLFDTAWFDRLVLAANAQSSGGYDNYDAGLMYDAGLTAEAITRQAELWRTALSDYYGVELTFSESELSFDHYSSVFKLLCDGNELRLEMVADGAVYFNP